MWKSITRDDVLKSLSDPELNSLDTAVTADGQNSPVDEYIRSVTRFVRSKALVCKQNKPGVPGTIPDELEDAALAIIRYRLLSRLPISSLTTDVRRKEYDDALLLLSDAAACRVLIEQPENVSEEKLPSGSSAQLIRPGNRQTTRRDFYNL